MAIGIRSLAAYSNVGMLAMVDCGPVGSIEPFCGTFGGNLDHTTQTGILIWIKWLSVGMWAVIWDDLKDLGG